VGHAFYVSESEVAEKFRVDTKVNETKRKTKTKKSPRNESQIRDLVEALLFVTGLNDMVMFL